MTTGWGFIVAVGLGLSFPGAAGAAEIGSLVAVSNNVGGANGAPDGTGTAITIDIDTGDGEFYADHVRPGFSMAYDTSSRTLYGVQGLGGGKQQLVTLNKATLEVESVIGVVSDGTSYYRVAAAAFTGSGQLYGIGAVKQRVGGVNVPVGVLVEIDPTDASATVVGSLGVPVYSRGGTVADGTFYLGTNTSNTSRELWVYDVDLSTGAATLIGDTGVLGDAIGMATGPDGELLAVMDSTSTSESSLYEIDASTGAASLIGASGFHYLSGFSYFDREIASCGIGASGDLYLENSALVDSWDCDSGSVDDGAELCVNGSVEAKNSAQVDGSVYYGGSISLENSASINGDTAELTADFDPPEVDTSSAAANNDNATIGLTDDGDDPLDGGLDFELSNTDEITLYEGIYYFDSMTVENKSVLHIDGDVVLYIEGDLEWKNSAEINPEGDPSQLTIYVAGTSVKLGNSADAYASIIAPDATIEVENTGDFYGKLVGEEVIVKNNANVHLAECL